ncbi:Alpha/Beta hydrolase protein [Glomus cerebriforme]|uniref:Alpha/Beta hydrolase protein n=1 Tax=Glomus cerebriforme TaxID=658196 RepID=A0A397SPV2_9GLOM|nr:Alpha/Beta hydrolase protein [Glomus cerebriforme]
MMTLYTLFSSIVKSFALVLLVFAITTIYTTDASPINRRQNPAPEADIREFKLWAQFASAAYCDVTDWKCGDACEGDTDGTRLIKFFQHSSPRDNNGYVAINDKEKAIIVAYRGTADIQSFIQDFQFIQSPFPPALNAKVHSGFFATYNDTKKEITSLVEKLVKENPTYKVISTGHSLGGSLAVFQTLDLIGTPGLNPSNLFTYTYGEPRIGNKDFAQFVMNSGHKFFRVVNKDDLVPHLPPRELDYIHYGPEFWINPNNDVVVCQNAEDNRCSNSLHSKSLLRHAKYFDTVFLLTCLLKK